MIVDFGLPDQNGVEISARIHTISPKMPIVVITGWVLDYDNQTLARSGILRVLRKPVGLAEIEDVIRQAIF